MSKIYFSYEWICCFRLPYFHTYQNHLVNLHKFYPWDFILIALRLQINLVRVNIVKILSFRINEQGIILSFSFAKDISIDTNYQGQLERGLKDISGIIKAAFSFKYLHLRQSESLTARTILEFFSSIMFIYSITVAML